MELNLGVKSREFFFDARQLKKAPLTQGSGPEGERGIVFGEQPKKTTSSRGGCERLRERHVELDPMRIGSN